MTETADILAAWGWSPGFAARLEELRAERDADDPELSPGRVLIELRGVQRLVGADGEVEARVGGRLHHAADSPADLPAVGDWVAYRPGTAPGEPGLIEAVLPRDSAFVRRAAGGRTEEQVVAANVDTVFLVTGLDGDFNPRRIERYLSVAWDSGARPVVLLSKADLVDDPDEFVEAVEAVAPGIDVHAIINLEGGAGDEASHRSSPTVLAPYLVAGETVAFLGSSGVGKSTLVNRLLGRAVQKVGEVRSDDSRGRHTTTHRQLFRLPGGALAVDTPGMRELQVWEGSGGLESTFEDVEALGARCKFRDCRHREEPGCAVRRAVEEGELAAERLESFHKLQDEHEALAARVDERARSSDKRSRKVQQKALRRYYRDRDRDP